MHLPKRIRIGWRWYKVLRWKNTEASSARRFGECDKNCGLIRVDPSYGPAKTAHTLLHETLHAIWDARNLHDEAKEEDVVIAFADGLCTLARDNPDVVQDWLNVMRSDT